MALRTACWLSSRARKREKEGVERDRMVRGGSCSWGFTNMSGPVLTTFHVFSHLTTKWSWCQPPLFIYFFTLQYCIGFAIHQHASATGVHVFPSWTPLPPLSPYHPSGSSQCTSPKPPVSCIEPGLAICFLYDIIHVLMPFSQIIPTHTHTESKILFYTSVSLLLSRIQGCRYHLSKFHIYALVYCIGVVFSGLLHSV